MAEIESFDSQTLARAVVIWTGYGSAAWPTREDEVLFRMFPTDEAAKLASIVRSLEEDFYKSQAHLNSRSLSEMGRLASSDFKHLHPTLPEEIVNSFAWCYTFDYK